MGGPGRLRWLWLSVVIVAVDRMTKFAIEWYTPEGFHRVIVPGVINIVHTSNPGIAFGMFSNVESKWLTGLLEASSIIAIGLLSWLLATDRAGEHFGRPGLALIIGGAAGNLTDRLLHGSVTDFFEVWLGSYRWPAFNVADSAISIGAALVVIELLFGHRHPKGEKA